MNEQPLLIVEDSRTFAKFLSRKIRSSLQIPVEVLHSFAAARERLQTVPCPYALAILDLVLPDAMNGEIVDYCLERGLPVIVLTSEFSMEMRERILGKRIVDYILKEELVDQNDFSLDYLLRLIERLRLNPSIQILVVDDSSTARRHLRRMLEVHRFEVLEAGEGTEALQLLQKHPRIRLVFVDWNMPGMDGFELVHAIRKTHGMDEVAVIGISVYETETLAAKFLKKGANDFITKPFLNEELYLRVMQNIQHIENIRAIRESSHRDYLTGLHNRKYFFEEGESRFQKALAQGETTSVAMVDLDYFKKVNDTFGHAAGDAVLCRVAERLRLALPETCLVARMGGEEFIVLEESPAGGGLPARMEQLRKDLETKPLALPDATLKVTISAGVALKGEENLDKMIRKADYYLYQAKAAGRNRVVTEEGQFPDD